MALSLFRLVAVISSAFLMLTLTRIYQALSHLEESHLIAQTNHGVPTRSFMDTIRNDVAHRMEKDTIALINTLTNRSGLFYVDDVLGPKRLRPTSASSERAENLSEDHNVPIPKKIHQIWMNRATETEVKPIRPIPVFVRCSLYGRKPLYRRTQNRLVAIGHLQRRSAFFSWALKSPLGKAVFYDIRNTSRLADDRAGTHLEGAALLPVSDHLISAISASTHARAVVAPVARALAQLACLVAGPRVAGSRLG
jgi:hypothetical protein